MALAVNSLGMNAALSRTASASAAKAPAAPAAQPANTQPAPAKKEESEPFWKKWFKSVIKDNQDSLAQSLDKFISEMEKRDEENKAKRR
jgi:hypothetical protein